MKLELNRESLVVFRHGQAYRRLSLLGLLQAWDREELLASDRVSDRVSKIQFPACAAFDVYQHYEMKQKTPATSATALLLTSMILKRRKAMEALATAA